LISAAGLIPAAIGVSYFEVFEDAKDPGSRWKKAQSLSSKVDLDSALLELSIEDAEKTEPYDFEYEPDFDDFPGTSQRYQHDMDLIYYPEKKDGITRELYNPEDEKHYKDWKIAMKDMQIPPLMPKDVNDAFVGAEGTFFAKTASKSVKRSYLRGSRQGSKWKNIEQVYKSELEKTPITGPPGFRDATPNWIKDVLEKSVRSDGSRSPERKREFGTYRRSMWKIDKDIEPLKADGVQDDPKKVVEDNDEEEGFQ